MKSLGPSASLRIATMWSGWIPRPSEETQPPLSRAPPASGSRTSEIVNRATGLLTPLTRWLEAIQPTGTGSDIP